LIFFLANDFTTNNVLKFLAIYSKVKFPMLYSMTTSFTYNGMLSVTYDSKSNLYIAYLWLDKPRFDSQIDFQN
jgi:hypothetical protein